MVKCRNCTALRKGYFPLAPNSYVCTGVPEPFVVTDIDRECTEYLEYSEKTPAELEYTESICTHCLICGDIVINESQSPKICDKCKDAVMSLRRLLEYLEEETNEDT